MDPATADNLLAIAEEARARSRQQDPEAATLLEDRYLEAMDALDWFYVSELPDRAYRLATALVPFWISTKRISDGDAWFERALGTNAGSKPSRARALHDHGYLVFWAGGYEVARQRFASSLELAQQIDDGSVQALALAGLARVALDTDPGEAVRLLRRALAITEDLADSDYGRSSALHVLGVALQMSGDLDGAREVMASRLSMGRATGDEFVVWVESANLSMVERRLGNLELAEELALQALAIDAARGDEMSIAWTINSVAAVNAARGELIRAATLSTMAASMLERAGGEWPPDERVQYDETLAIVTAGLQPDELERARARGVSSSITDSVAYALSKPE